MVKTRYCLYGECGTILSLSNPGKYCFRHQRQLAFEATERLGRPQTTPPRQPRVYQVAQLEVFRGLLSTQPADAEGILASVCAVFRVTPTELRNAIPRRTDLPRMVVAYLLKFDLQFSYQRVADFLECPYQTVVYAVARITWLSRREPRLQEILKLVQRQYRTPAA
jgi:chromosomal replication initiation ATPase DnaA